MRLAVVLVVFASRSVAAQPIGPMLPPPIGPNPMPPGWHPVERVVDPSAPPLETRVPAIVATPDPIVDGPAPIAPHANVGVEVLGGVGGVMSVAARFHFGFDGTFGRGMVRPSLGVGATFSAGSCSKPDATEADGRLSRSCNDYGGEVQLGVRFVDGGAVDTRVFGSFAVVRTGLEHFTRDGSIGMRGAIGVNWADRVGALMHDGESHVHHEGDDDDGDSDLQTLFFLFAPHQLEVIWERGQGEDRFGAALSWGI